MLRRHGGAQVILATAIETFPLEKAAQAYARMMSGKAEFRVVLTL